MTVNSAIVIYPLPFLCIEHSQVYFLLFQEPQTAAHLYVSPATEPIVMLLELCVFCHGSLMCFQSLFRMICK
ncbi:hypothetical protein B0T09DRAFT_84020 [Sordaria sp. MPI-SDFR-AT-0083]|nr:hypothetical protein B0T09DRAFT_84020 [Sordaria sp. MPI-SDFR-AT-0083]